MTAAEPKTPKPESLEAKFRLMTLAPFDKRMKRKHLATYGFILDWFHSKYGDALASVRHTSTTMKERDPDGVGFYLGDIHTALSDLVAWGYLTQEKGSGRRASRYVPVWSKFDSVHKTPNATGDEISVRENQNTSVRETPNTTADSVHKIPNEDPSTGPGHQTRGQVDGNNMFDATPTAPLSVGQEATDAVAASGGFEGFWSAWPRKHGKAKAKAAWRKLSPDAELTGRIMDAARTWTAHYEKHGVEKKFIPEPANWLAGERWDEDLPLVHVDAKGAAISKAKANAPARKIKPVADNDNDDSPPTRGPMVCDVGPFAPHGTFDAVITGSNVEWVNPETKKVVLDLTWSDSGHGPDATHTFYHDHPDKRLQLRGRIFLKQLTEHLDIDELTDTEQLHGQRVRCTINDRLAISYKRAA